MKSLAEPLCPEFRLNTLRAQAFQILSLLEREQIPLIPLIDGLAFRTSQQVKIGNLISSKLGYIYPQAVTSVVAGLALLPSPHSFVLDLCAAPGSKTTLMAQLMGNTGLIVANELFKDRLPAMGQNLLRLGVINTIVTSYQAQEFPRALKFDYVMADVPCSSEGNFRIRERGSLPKRWNIQGLVLTQKRIILRAYELLKEGGLMVYSTCTYNPAENEEVVNHLLENTNAHLVPFHVPIPSEPGITSWQGKSYKQEMVLARRFYPHQTGSVGFFIALIKRPGSS